MAGPSSYQVVVVGQRPLPVEDELRASVILGAQLRCRTEVWNESLAIADGDARVDLIVAVVAREAEDARRLLDWLRGQPAKAPVLAVLPMGVAAETLAATAEVADDFILWPLRAGELDQRLRKVLAEVLGERPAELEGEVERVREQLNEELALSHLVGTDAAFLRTVRLVLRVAASDGTVLITGETGTGKELVARAVHHLSRRRAFPFVPADCAGLPELLIDNELFGHVRGAFTDAHRDQKGLVALAAGGTLFLDEVDALSLPSQAKLLRFLEDHVYKPLGGERFERADVRVVAATNRDLEAAVKAGRFRADLFFRLNVFRLQMAPLRQRPGDVALLARHFCETLAADVGRTKTTLSPDALQCLGEYDWPGNVRQLRNEIQRALAFAEGPQILPCHLGLPTPAAGTPRRVGFREARDRVLADFERTYVADMLGQHGGNVTRAAREAGKERRAFGRLVKKHRLGPPPE
ncbi:MAG TPA: sigma-54 dependent transcriptional regulator [Thermoanaerobaculia bacterium]|nr:sigma-54 dependent transcriptional regulator [Thermoanaerobaculia bacterium]